MKLIFIYGSPASGKLTVANEIAKRTGFRVFHNHLSIDCIEPIFEFGSPPFFRLIELIRYEVVAEAAREDRNLVYTFCYAKDLDDAHAAEVARRVEENGGEVCFVQLVCDKEVLKQRVTEESRKLHGKAGTPEQMDYYFRTYDLFSPVPGRESLRIDNTDLPAEDAAQQIVDHYGLQVEKEKETGL
jgi:deoxyadenosine/deoxycytidine kinase